MKFSAIIRCMALLVAVCGLALGSVNASEHGNEGDEHKSVERGADGLPIFHHPYTDGLYSCVTAMNTFWVPELKKQKKIKLKVPGFKKDMQVYSIMQEQNAPLVVVLQGVDGKVEGPFGDLFPYWYAEAGYHTLTFDSPYTPQYPEICGQGVVGNFEAEADQTAAIIQAFLKTQDPQKRITQIGVIGLSFGGTQALVLAAKANAGTLPFKLEGCLALSPPVKLKTAGGLVDHFFVEDRWDTTMVELAKKFGPHVPVAEGEPIPFTAKEMRGAIGFVFRDGLTKVVDRNDRYYNLRILPEEGGMDNRQSYAEATSVSRFIEKFSFPYWQKKGVVKTPDELWQMSELALILPRLPDYAQAVVAENDPFNTTEDLAEAQAADVNHRMIVLPRGGHLGYIAADWTLVKALRIFKESGQPVAVPAEGKPDKQGTKANEK